jgi:hypothetical protein
VVTDAREFSQCHVIVRDLSTLLFRYRVRNSDQEPGTFFQTEFDESRFRVGERGQRGRRGQELTETREDCFRVRWASPC